jgi:histone H3/H4
LAWATAGVPRDFLQMFARAVEHARRNKRAVVTLSDVNVAIGEFGQGKMDELSK